MSTAVPTSLSTIAECADVRFHGDRPWHRRVQVVLCDDRQSVLPRSGGLVPD